MEKETGPTQFVLGKIGLNTRHMAGTVVSAPRGSSSCLLMQFCTPARVNTAAGLVSADNGDCLILTPYFPA